MFGILKNVYCTVEARWKSWISRVDSRTWMTAFYGTFDRAEQEEESLRTIAKALELGVNFLDTAWIYQVLNLL